MSWALEAKLLYNKVLCMGPEGERRRIWVFTSVRKEPWVLVPAPKTAYAFCIKETLDKIHKMLIAGIPDSQSPPVS